ncbi:aminoglycoside 3'-phosphotransferase/choline kinase family protein [Streptomyces sannanensis]|uniref:Aminoglycoside 3'-phosphotransferase/choline kinase family protein n=1 Tax=Streptomyces sannanensis TaxID=285536 RepID=A0ABP6SMN2_9ACTN
MLPAVDTDEQWDKVIPDDEALRPGVEDLCARLGFADVHPIRYPDGSEPVYAIGDRHVLKLFPRMWLQDALTENRVLGYIQGRLPIPVPELLEFGEYENGWHYVLMSQLPGEGLATAWPRIPKADRDRIVTEVGEALAVLHSLDPEPLTDVLGPENWGAALADRRARAVERQRERGLPEHWLEQIPDFLDAVPLAADPPRSLLHTEVMRQHLIVDPDGWRLTGLIDFEPAMIGDRAYDFVGIGLYVSCGDPRLLGRIMKAYGHEFDPRELLAHTLLHVYSNLPRYFKDLPEPPEPTLDSLAETWFGITRA